MSSQFECKVWVRLSAKLWVHTNSLIINEFAVWVRLHSMSSQFECSWVRDSFRSLCLRKYLTQRYGLRILIWVIQLNLESAESDQILLNLNSADSADSEWLILQNQTRIYWILGFTNIYFGKTNPTLKFSIIYFSILW